MKITLKVLAAILAITWINSSCSNDSQEDLFPELGICDTLDISYSADIVPVFVNNCYSCHSNESNSSGILLDSYDNLSQYAENGKLLGAVRHDDGYIPMPINAGKLDECSIFKMEAWVNQ